MIAGNVVPSNAVIVDVVEDREARFTGSVDIEFGVVRLTLFLVSSGRPWVVVPSSWSLVGRCHLFPVRGPEPTEQVFGFQVCPVFATFEIANSA